uniref:autotransporter outer membrane beta-barrel domain-containing protein n=1 Tax=Lonepinella sp. BR2882 TaxID=3095283 RepID=UPI003F6E20C3
MKAAHFKYSALTLALMSNFAISNLVQVTQTTDVDSIFEQNSPHYELTNTNIRDSRPSLASLYINNVTTAVVKKVSIMHSEKQVGIARFDNSNITIDGLNITSTNKNSYFGVFFRRSNASINNMTVDATIGRSLAGSPFYGALYFGDNAERASVVTNSSITNHGDSSAIVWLDNSNATFRNVELNATGKDSTLFSTRDSSRLIADNITANNTGKDGFFLKVEKNTAFGERYHSFAFENSHITSDHGVNWITNGDDSDAVGNVQTVDISLSNTTLEAKDQLVHAIRNDHDIFTTVFELQNNSTLIGGFKEPNSIVDITLDPVSTWRMTSDSHIDHLSSLGETSTIDFAYDNDQTKTLTIAGQYSGSHSFNLNSKLANDQSDKIVIEHQILGNSRAILNITDRSGNDKFENPNHSATVLEATPDYASNITVTLNGTNYVNAGGYRYHLANETTNGQAIWKLTNLLEDGNPVKDPDFNKPKVEEPKAEDPKVEDPKAEDPKVEDPKVEDPKVEDPKVEDPKVEGAKVEGPSVGG